MLLRITFFQVLPPCVSHLRQCLPNSVQLTEVITTYWRKKLVQDGQDLHFKFKESFIEPDFKKRES